jgi:hypothetical protein
MRDLAGNHAADGSLVVIRQSAGFAMILQSEDSTDTPQYRTERCDQACRHNA